MIKSALFCTKRTQKETSTKVIKPTWKDSHGTKGRKDCKLAAHIRKYIFASYFFHSTMEPQHHCRTELHIRAASQLRPKMRRVGMGSRMVSRMVSSMVSSMGLTSRGRAWVEAKGQEKSPHVDVGQEPCGAHWEHHPSVFFILSNCKHASLYLSFFPSFFLSICLPSWLLSLSLSLPLSVPLSLSPQW